MCSLAPWHPEMPAGASSLIRVLLPTAGFRRWHAPALTAAGANLLLQCVAAWLGAAAACPRPPVPRQVADARVPGTLAGTFQRVPARAQDRLLLVRRAARSA